MYLGSSFFLACCGLLLEGNDTNLNPNETHNAQWTTEENDNVLNSTTLGDYPSWIAPPSEAKSFPVDVKDKEIDFESGLGISSSPFEEEEQSTANIQVFNETSTPNGDSEVLRIKILNNGSPTSPAVVIQSPTYSTDRSEATTNVSVSTKVPHLGTLYSLPKEAPIETLPWWKTSIFYQVYPRSFKDTTNSGTGDLVGITEKADYLKELGIGAVWISPFYVSPMADFGYDIADYRNVDPIFGTMDDFNQLLKEFHKRDIKIILDFIPNHSSDQHEWFKKSWKREDPYTDYYIWQNPKEYNETGHPVPPNNWISVFGGSAWEWVPERKQFYLHQFLKEQPDLNVRNPLVMEQLDNILKFWLDKEVDGFRVDAIKHLFEIEDFSLDEPLSGKAEVDSNQYDYLIHNCSTNQPETIEAISRWRKILDKYPNRVMITEIYDDDINEIMKYYDNETDLRSHFPFNFYLITELGNRSDVTGLKLKEIANHWLEAMPSRDNWPNWVLGNHDRSRVASRLGEDLIDSLNMFLLLLPGTPTTYYGEEIGMEDNYISFEEAKDPFGIHFGEERYAEFGRDPQRTPMQWEDTLNAGFSQANETWLPIHPNFPTINVKTQREQNGSHLNIYKRIAELRREPTFQRGKLDFPAATQNIIVVKRKKLNFKVVMHLPRSLPDFPTYLLVINTSGAAIKLIDETNLDAKQLLEIVICSSCPEDSFGKDLDLSSLSLNAGEGIVVKLL